MLPAFHRQCARPAADPMLPSTRFENERFFAVMAAFWLMLDFGAASSRGDQIDHSDAGSARRDKVSRQARRKTRFMGRRTLDVSVVL
jgi:hypothetical protein